ncbi:helix-turn-helix transcriptional regulator [Cupriavidus taiwanensis]|uniref:helix-turn-helix transcriptional regulator n=1 Tax=Cupriavidus taiwanensis TaxID=164546 RepID=UPI0025405AB0|nr:helix-turn-helix transcriptional regulator [Cupriavidus taiwanensis]MDK3025024.1 helix-turn-helix transcriptional regulator [Cupriavidus taiwanensis]
MPPKFLLMLAVFPLYQAWDLYQLVHSGPSFHFYAETAATVAFLVILGIVIRERRRALHAVETLKHSADAAVRAAAERDAAAQRSTRDFLQSMQEQFQRWGLTPAERDVALLLVKGLSLEEIAGVRETGAKTVRQHAANLYAKAKVSGRHQLAAFFFEDLLAPRPGGGA